MGSFAADHVVTDPDAFAEAVRLAAEVARDDWLVTLGIEPTHPSTAFGYMLMGEPLAEHPGAHVVAGFVEKPAIDLADQYLASGSYRWNAGMFVVRPRVLLDLLAQWHPDFAERAAPDRRGPVAARGPVAHPAPDRAGPRRGRAGRRTPAASPSYLRRSGGTTSATSTPCRTCSRPTSAT